MVTWDLKDILKDKNSLLKEIEERTELFQNYKKELKNISSERLEQIIEEYENIGILAKKIQCYTELYLTEKITDSERNSLYSKISEFTTEIGNKLLFFSLWFKNLDEDKAKLFIKKIPKYSYFLKSIISFKKHTLTEQEEKIISIKDLTGEEILTKLYDITTNNFIFEWNKKEITQEELKKYFVSNKKEDRKKAYMKLLNKYKENQHILGELYKGIILDWNNDNIKLRNFKDSIAPRNKSNDIKDKTIEVLLKVVRENISIFHEFYKIKSKLLGYKISRFDIYAPYKELNKKYSYEKSKKIVLETYKSFSEIFYNSAKEIFDSNHVHSEIKKGKRSGAFCLYVDNNIVPFVMLNHDNHIKDLNTMMHEFGHGIHGQLSKKQTYLQMDSSIPMAETASTFGETLLFETLFKKGNKEEKIILLNDLFLDLYSSIIRQSYFTIFEKDAHKLIMKGCSNEDLNKLYFDNLKEQFGNSISISDDFQYEWNYIPHIHHSPFYCYSYAFGNLLALSLFNIYKKDKEKFVKKYIKLLESGGSESTENLLKNIMNIDITKEEFWQQGFNLIKDYLKDFKELIKEE